MVERTRSRGAWFHAPGAAKRALNPYRGYIVADPTITISTRQLAFS
jgi:hypothetical protein